MNREDIIRMAQEAGGFLGEVPRGDAWMFAEEEYLERFAALVASAERNRTWTQDHWTEYEHAIVAQEREACIVDIQWHIPRSGRHTPEYQMAMRMIERIRARGQA